MLPSPTCRVKAATFKIQRSKFKIAPSLPQRNFFLVSDGRPIKISFEFLVSGFQLEKLTSGRIQLKTQNSKLETRNLLTWPESNSRSIHKTRPATGAG